MCNIYWLLFSTISSKRFIVSPESAWFWQFAICILTGVQHNAASVFLFTQSLTTIPLAFYVRFLQKTRRSILSPTEWQQVLAALRCFFNCSKTEDSLKAVWRLCEEFSWSTEYSNKPDLEHGTNFSAKKVIFVSLSNFAPASCHMRWDKTTNEKNSILARCDGGVTHVTVWHEGSWYKILVVTSVGTAVSLITLILASLADADYSHLVFT